MTRTIQARRIRTAPATLGEMLRHLREERELQLWKVGHAAEMDSALLSKIERGYRLPTHEQTAALAKFFGVDPNELESMRMAEKFLSDNAHNPAAVALAAARIHEGGSEYLVKRKPIAASKQRKL